MSILDFTTTAAAPSRNNGNRPFAGQTGPSDDKPASKLWMNIGYEINGKFVSLPLGLPIDTMREASTNGTAGLEGHLLQRRILAQGATGTVISTLLTYPLDLVNTRLKVQRQLHRVDVGRLRVIKRMEQQPLLQRRQRKHILKVRILALQPLKLSLRHRNQRNIRRRPAVRLNFR